MSESIASHGYMPEEHAPDPVISHGDPTPPGKVGIWLFLASEVMFFLAILGSYIVVRAAHHEVFAKQALALSKLLAGINTVVLILSSLTMALSVEAAQKHNMRRLWVCLLLTVACGAVFLAIKWVEYHDKWVHYTIVAKDPSAATSFGQAASVFIYDGEREVETDSNGHTIIKLTGYRTPMPEAQPGGASFDIHRVSQYDVIHEAAARHLPADKPQTFEIDPANVNTQLNYGPWKDLFFSSYFTLTGIHALHVVGGMIALSILLAQALRRRVFPAHTEYVGIYWHFVDLVWIFLFPLLYLI